MGLTKEDLLCHSRYIRDTLALKLSIDGNHDSGKPFIDLSHLRAALDQLTNSPMTLDTLRFSRMEKALQRIVEANGGDWPPDIVVKAKSLIAQWEKSLGPLQRVRTDFWGPGGRLEGFAKPHGWFKWESAQQQVSVTSPTLQIDAHRALGKSPEMPTWTVGEKHALAQAYKEGHCGFKIGE